MGEYDGVPKEVVALRKEQTGRYNTSVPCLIIKIGAMLDCFTNHPALPLPWPIFVPPPERLHQEIACLEVAYQAMTLTSNMTTIAAVSRARRMLKTSMGKVIRYIELTVRDPDYVAGWPGFDLRRNPGGGRKPRPDSLSS